MNRKALRILWLGVFLAVLCTMPANGQTVRSDDTPTWESLATGCPAGLDDRRWQRLVGQLKDNGLPVQAAQECLAPAQEAARDGLPTEPVLMRIEEGATKRVEPKALQEAGRQRLGHLKTAADVLRQAGYGTRNAAHDQLMKSVALALESGLSPPTLQDVLTRARGGQSERMRSIVEAGETMYLNGMDEPTVAQMMNDFTERNMRRTEVMRACHFAVQQHQARMTGARIRQQLWDRGGEQWRGGAGPSGPGGPGVGEGPAGRGGGPAGAGGFSGSGGSPSSPGASPGDSGGSGPSGTSGSGTGSQPGPGSPSSPGAGPGPGEGTGGESSGASPQGSTQRRSR